MADKLVAGVGFDDMFMDLLRQLVVRKLDEGAAEGGFAGNFPGTLPAAKLAQQRAGLERINDARWWWGTDRRFWR